MAVLLTHDPIFREFDQCQNDLLILFGFTLSLYWSLRYPETAGIILGCIANIKYQALIFIPLLILRAYWRMLIGLVVGLIAAALLPAVMIGWERNLEYLLFAWHGIVNMVSTASENGTDIAARMPSILWGYNISITSGLARIFYSYGQTVVDALCVAAILMGSLLIILAKIFSQYDIPFFWRSPQGGGDFKNQTAIANLEWWSLVLVMLIFSPQCSMRHLVLLLNYNLLIAVMLLFPRPGIKRWSLILAPLFIQIGQFRFGFGFSFGDFVGLPSWGYLLSLPIVFNHTLLTLHSYQPVPTTTIEMAD